MKKFTRIISMICVIAMLFSSFSLIMSASESENEMPLEPEIWTEPDFSTDHAYSIAFVGDTQYITNGDDYYGTKKLNKIYKYIADTAEERKLGHVFVLGDITDGGYWNDGSLAGHHENPPKFGEWEVAKEAISQLDGKVSYSLCRGNHDDYAIDDYFNVPAYTDQFKGCGGFFSDVEGKHSTVRDIMKDRNPEGYILWSAKKEQETGDGRYTSSIVNSYKTMELSGTKYLLVTVDFNPTKAVLDWLNGLLAKYPDHRAIITTHAYLNGSTVITSNTGDTMYPTPYTPDKLWDLVLSKHKNVFMVVSGHVGVNDIACSYNVGENGNKVLQVLVDPQSYDLKDVSYNGPLSTFQGKQDTGLVLYMNFSEDGNTITFYYYSTLLDKFLKISNNTVRIDDEQKSDVDRSVVIDMANLGFGQTVSVIEKKRMIVLNGSVKRNEYPLTVMSEIGEIGKGRINSALTESFSYDSKNIYYAFSGNFTGGAPILELRPADTVYTVGELLDGAHNRRLTVVIDEKNCEFISNADIELPVNEKDISCRMTSSSTTGIKTYELKISRSYLENNGFPTDLFSYSLKFTTGTRCFALNNKAQQYLGAFGVNNLDWTYNYVYLGERGSVTKNPKAPENAWSSYDPGENDPADYSTLALDYALDAKNTDVEIIKVPVAYKTPKANGVIDEGEYSYSYKEESKPIYMKDPNHTRIADDIMKVVGAADLKNAVLNKNYFDYAELIDKIEAEYYFAQDNDNIYIATRLDIGAFYFDEDNNGIPDTIDFGGETVKRIKAVISRDHLTYRLGFNMDDPSDCIYIANNMGSLFDATELGTKTLIIGDNKLDITGNGIITQMYRCSVAKESGWDSHKCNSIVKKGQMINNNNPGTDRYVINEIVINKAALLKALNENGIEYKALPNAFFFSMYQNGQVIGQLNDEQQVGWLSDGDAGFWSLNGSRYVGSNDFGNDVFPDLVVFTDSTDAPTKEHIFANLDIPAETGSNVTTQNSTDDEKSGCASSFGIASVGLIACMACGAVCTAKKNKKKDN